MRCGSGIGISTSVASSCDGTRAQFLVRRQKEPNDVYAERLSRVFYENYLGSCIDWYASTLFRSRPVTTFRSGSQRVEDFYARFLDDGGPDWEVVARDCSQSVH